MPIAYTRAMVTAILDSSLRDVATEPDPIFGVHIPVACPGVPPELLQPRSTWPDKSAYDLKARDLARRFNENFKQFAGTVEPEVAAAGPNV
jgi:phosphoenolpyruvate carboxykinase (ATP)